jgi:hypothetical protein
VSYKRRLGYFLMMRGVLGAADAAAPESAKAALFF